ncbi:hypothetical protein [Spirosoma aerolatum]|uniref:hypothetical protein n=1 Tax=Spirosoma aerolatum TaxID=1211326 RepID=UPI0009AE2D2A|nr:hypothetical protein [Spirosoma aerolatum]
MNTNTVHPEFDKALSMGHVVPVLLPNGEPFIIEGIQFYQASDDGVNMYQGRLMSFTDVIEKHNRLKLDETTLRAYFTSIAESATQAILQLSSDPEQAVKYLTDIATLSSFGQQRLDLYEETSELNVGSNTARVYELASIWFFSSDEDPASHDPVKGKRNVMLMLKRPELYDFFLRMRLNRFAPLASASEENTLNAIRAIREADYNQFLLFTQSLLRFKMNGANPAMTQRLESLLATLNAYDTCYDQLLKTLTTTWPRTSENNSMMPSN